jgi:hypothetical protein
MQPVASRYTDCSIPAPLGGKIEKLKKTIPVLKYAIKHYAMKACGKWRYSATIIDHGTK